jgi:Fe/S biogenesis protein NfuA
VNDANETAPGPRITISERARAKFLEAVAAEGRTGQGLRVVVHDGGTAQPSFALNFVAPGEDVAADAVIAAGGFAIHADPESARWLDEAVIDYVDTLTESGFKVEAPHSGIPRPSGPVADAVQRVLEEKINPAVASHGGHVSLVAIAEETVYLRFGGGCQGCGMVNVTLKQGVERTLFTEVPQIKHVMDVTDHASGANPYYQPAK